MHRYGVAHWGLRLTAFFLIAGAALIWLGTSTPSASVRIASFTSGPALLLMAAVMLVVTAWARVKQDANDRRMHKYSCPQCGYQPHLDEVEHQQSFPCPMCGNPVYE